MLPLLSTLLLSGAAQADDDKKPRRLSIDFSAGVTPDMAGLGSTIAQDGTVDTSSTTIANLLYSTDKAFMSDQSNMTIWHNSQDTDSTFNLMGAEPVVGGPLLGREIGGRVRYELDDLIRYPLFIQAGAYFSKRVSGGYQERVLGDAAEQNSTVALLLALNGASPDEYVGGKMTNQYDASWMEIPISLGIKVPSKRPYTFAYGSAGVSIFKGGFSVAFDADENYANALATHVDTENYTINNLSPGAVSDKIDFVLDGVGLNYAVGVQAGIKPGLAFFGELNSSGAAGSVYSTDLKPETKQLLTALSSETLATEDPEWFDKLAYPVVATGASFRLGLRYYFL